MDFDKMLAEQAPGKPLYQDEDIEKVIKEAQDQGFTVYRSSPTTLLVDIDDEGLMNYKAREILEKTFELKISDRWISRSGKGVHYVFTCKTLEFPARVALQLALGSDPVKEALALRLWSHGIPEPDLLFRPKPEETPNILDESPVYTAGAQAENPLF